MRMRMMGPWNTTIRENEYFSTGIQYTFLNFLKYFLLSIHVDCALVLRHPTVFEFHLCELNLEKFRHCKTAYYDRNYTYDTIDKLKVRKSSSNVVFYALRWIILLFSTFTTIRFGMNFPTKQSITKRTYKGHKVIINRIHYIYENERRPKEEHQ